MCELHIADLYFGTLELCICRVGGRYRCWLLALALALELLAVVASAGRGSSRRVVAGGAKLKRSAASSSPLQLAGGRRRSSIAHYPSHPHARPPRHDRLHTLHPPRQSLSKHRRRPPSQSQPWTRWWRSTAAPSMRTRARRSSSSSSCTAAPRTCRSSLPCPQLPKCGSPCLFSCVRTHRLMHRPRHNHGCAP